MQTNPQLTRRIREFCGANKRLILCLLLYRLSLELCYVFVISPRFSVSLMTTDLNWGKFLVSLLLTAATVAVFPTDGSKPSSYLYGIGYVLIFVPTVCYYWLNDQPTAYILFETGCFLMIALGLRFSRKGLKQGGKPSRLRIPAGLGLWAVRGMFAVYVLSTLALIVMNGGLDIRALSWGDVYALRSENQVSGIWAYMLNWCAKSFMPFFFACFLVRKERVGMAFVCVLQALTFLAFGFKAFAMAVVLLIGVSFLMWWDEKRFCADLMGVLALGNVLVSVIDKLKITDLGMLLLPYRTLMLPAQGQYEYYDFFTHHDYLYFSEGMLGRLLGIPYPYDDQIGRVVNAYIYGPEKISNGNTGIFSYGFADCGFAGMILAALILLAVLIIVDRSTTRLPVVLPVCAMAYQMFVLNDTGILISLNTGGIAWTVLLLMLMNLAYPGPGGLKRLRINQWIDSRLFGWMEPLKASLRGERRMR